MPWDLQILGDGKCQLDQKDFLDGAVFKTAPMAVETRTNDTEIARAAMAVPMMVATSDGLTDAPMNSSADAASSGALGLKTDEVGFAVMLSRTPDGNEPGIVNFMSTPGRCDVNWSLILERSKLTFPGAVNAVARHRGCFSVTLNSVDKSREARFDAMRRLICIGAVFAKLPICVGVYNPSADHLVEPRKWVTAAATAVQGKLPHLEWISLVVAPVPDGNMPVPHTVSSIGFAAFTGREITMPLARVPPSDAGRWVFSAMTMVMEYGHILRDSDTIGPEEEIVRVQVRYWPEGLFEAQVDMWALLHPNSVFGARAFEEKTFGPRQRKPAPAGLDNSIRGDKNSLRDRLSSLVAGRRR